MTDLRQRCQKCKKRLDHVVWLDLNKETGQYSDHEWPDDLSQGAFPFGEDCAKIVLKRGRSL